MFNYAEDGINWDGATYSFVGPVAGPLSVAGAVAGALAGYNVGDGVRHLKLPGSLSEDIQYIDNTTGNTGREGQWVFLLDGECYVYAL